MAQWNEELESQYLEWQKIHRERIGASIGSKRAAPSVSHYPRSHAYTDQHQVLIDRYYCVGARVLITVSSQSTMEVVSKRAKTTATSEGNGTGEHISDEEMRRHFEQRTISKVHRSVLSPFFKPPTRFFLPLPLPSLALFI